MSNTKTLKIIKPNWPAPPTVKAASTTRIGGESLAPFDSFNLALHVGDSEKQVSNNRKHLLETLKLRFEPVWLNQVHSNKVIRLPEDIIREADASYTQQVNIPCVVMTADCLPVLFTNESGTEIAAAHAGWRGLADNVLENTVRQFACQTQEILAWLGPAISQKYFEVGEEVRQAFVANSPMSEKAFKSGENNKWFADIYELARVRIKQLGITKIYSGDYCTYDDKSQFYSFRRDGQTGRMASMIWLTDE